MLYLFRSCDSSDPILRKEQSPESDVRCTTLGAPCRWTTPIEPPARFSKQSSWMVPGSFLYLQNWGAFKPLIPQNLTLRITAEPEFHFLALASLKRIFILRSHTLSFLVGRHDTDTCHGPVLPGILPPRGLDVCRSPLGEAPTPPALRD